MPDRPLLPAPTVRAVHVVIPARNEESSLGAALRGVDTARRALAVRRPEIAVDVTVALDRCDDGSAAIVRAHPGTGWIELGAGDVGRARAIGVAWALAGSRLPPVVRYDATWIANTDADSAVPADWLTCHVDHAERGADLVLGLVRPVGQELTPQRLHAWLTRHDLRDGHGHVFGANLGVRATAYRAVGGFRPMSACEDVDLAHRIRRAGFRWAATGTGTVLTSARAQGRLDQGFAAALHALPLRPSRTVA